uniref:Uncharacterized protein n=1 Tax=Heterorhabditis bacteriophora TaxID=37862 RepID=A0A1I7W9F9_HETBA
MPPYLYELILYCSKESVILMNALSNRRNK